MTGQDSVYVYPLGGLDVVCPAFCESRFTRMETSHGSSDKLDHVTLTLRPPSGHDGFRKASPHSWRGEGGPTGSSPSGWTTDSFTGLMSAGLPNRTIGGSDGGEI